MSSLKFCVLWFLNLFTFIFNVFVTSESMYIFMMIEKKISIFINFCNFFFVWNRKAFVPFCIFPPKSKFSQLLADSFIIK